MGNNYKRLFVVGVYFMSFFSIFGQSDTTEINRLFEMSLSDLLNQEIVTSSKFSQALTEAASSISVITYDEIKYFGYSTLAEVLNTRSGSYVSDDRNYTYTGSRGFSRPTDYNNRIVVLVNGHVVNELVYGSSFMDNELGINPEDIEKIEIIKGPGASVYGSGAMLNTINIITKDGKSGQGIRSSFEAGSFGTLGFTASAGTQLNNGNIFISAGAGNSLGENFYFPELDFPGNNDGISKGLDGEEYGNMLALLKTSNLTIEGGISSRKKGIPTGAFNTDLTSSPYTLDRRYFFETSYKKELGTFKYLQLRVSYDDYFYKGYYPSGGNDVYDRSAGKWAGVDLQFFTKAGNRNKIISGIEYKKIFRSDYKEWAGNNVYFNDNFPYSAFSVYIQNQTDILKNLKFTAGARYDWYSIFNNSVTPRLSLVYEYSGGSALKFIYNEGFRIPNMYEAFYKSEGCQKHNPDIRPEKIKAGEIEWMWQISKDFTGSVSVYRYNLTNLIDQYLDETDGLTSFRNLSKALGTGIETEMKFRHENEYGGFINMSLQKTKDILTGHILSNSPAFMLKSGINVNGGELIIVSPEIYFETGRKTLAGNNTGNLFLINISAVTGNLFKHFKLSMKIRNLLDLKYYSPAGYEHAMDMIIQPRRNFSVKLTANF